MGVSILWEKLPFELERCIDFESGKPDIALAFNLLLAKFRTQQNLTGIRLDPVNSDNGGYREDVRKVVDLCYSKKNAARLHLYAVGDVLQVLMVLNPRIRVPEDLGNTHIQYAENLRDAVLPVLGDDCQIISE